MNRRWWLFTYPNFYPGGGMEDLVGMYASEAEAIAAHAQMWNVEFDDADLVDVQEGLRRRWSYCDPAVEGRAWSEPKPIDDRSKANPNDGKHPQG